MPCLQEKAKRDAEALLKAQAVVISEFEKCVQYLVGMYVGRKKRQPELLQTRSGVQSIGLLYIICVLYRRK